MIYIHWLGAVVFLLTVFAAGYWIGVLHMARSAQKVTYSNGKGGSDQ